MRVRLEEDDGDEHQAEQHAAPGAQAGAAQAALGHVQAEGGEQRSTARASSSVSSRNQSRAEETASASS